LQTSLQKDADFCVDLPQYKQFMNLEFKKITSISKIQKKSKVVNFSVQKNENYFANGILTHNCYCKRHVTEGVVFYKNVNDILTAIDHHAWFATDEKNNQTDDKYITYDIGCNVDIGLHARQLPLVEIFDFFKKHERAKASFATKHLMPDLFNKQLGLLNDKVRLRVSLMPQKYANILEPNTPSIIERLNQITMLLIDGYEVHLNFSPVIVTDGWLEEYRDLFMLIDEIISPAAKKQMKCEVIFLTHNEKKHLFNVENNLPGENLLWVPELQETKISQYGGENIRYKRELKAQYIHEFKSLHSVLIPYCTIRYIF
jgi:spore photoproduct lyase